MGAWFRQQQEIEEIQRMGLIATEGEGVSFELAPQGVYRAVCVWVLDRGEHENSFKPGTTQRKVSLHFELVDESMSDGRPFMVSNIYTLSLNEKANLRQHLASWRGRDFTAEELKGFDLQNILGAPCQINVLHNIAGDKTFANIGAIMPLSKGMEKPAAKSTILFYNTQEHDENVWQLIPEGIRNKINRDTPNQAYQEYQEYQQESESFDDDIPF